jgi:alpha-tubulin suppressor-like RCC1 family protein
VEAAPAKKVQASRAHTCIETTTKTVECWGANQHGQLGDGTRDAKSLPTRVPNLSGVQKLSAGDGDFSCAVARGDSGGDSVYCWGLNDKGQLGQPLSVTSSPTPLEVPGLVGADKVFAGREHVCATLSDTTVFCWGANDHGQLGDGTFATRPIPAIVTGVIGMSEVAPGFSHTCGNESGNGIAKCWGANDRGQLGIGKPPGDRPTPEALEGDGWNEVTTDGDTSCGRRGGLSYCWGRNDFGQLGDGTTRETNVPVPVRF